MKPVTKIILTNDNGIKFFGEGPCRLLHCVEKTGSLRAAAMEMEMAYSKASKILKQAEENLGFSLTTRSTGGKDGGGSILTPEGKQLLWQYEAYRDACVKANQALYRQYFPRIGCVIMASGLGKRFGGNKLMADFHGKPMVHKALEATEGLFFKRVVVTRHESVAALCLEKNVDAVLHDRFVWDWKLWVSWMPVCSCPGISLCFAGKQSRSFCEAGRKLPIPSSVPFTKIPREVRCCFRPGPFRN